MSTFSGYDTFRYNAIIVKLILQSYLFIRRPCHSILFIFEVYL